MKNFSKLLFLLPLAFCCIKSNTSEAKVCFLVGLEEQCGRETFAEIKDCEKLGYSITEEICAAQGKTPGGAHCGDYWEKCVCDPSKFLYLETEDNNPYILTGDRCDNYRQYKVCPPEYKYGKITYSNWNPLSGVSYTKPTACENNSTPSGNSCKESYPIDLIDYSMDGGSQERTLITNEEKFTTCTCNETNYPYMDNAGFNSEYFVLDNECVGTDGISHYGSLTCNGAPGDNVQTYYGETCDSNYNFDPANDQIYEGLTCHKCTKKATCSEICSAKGGVGYTAGDCVAQIQNGANSGKYCQKQDAPEGCYCLISGGTCPINWKQF